MSSARFPRKFAIVCCPGARVPKALAITPLLTGNLRIMPIVWLVSLRIVALVNLTSSGRRVEKQKARTPSTDTNTLVNLFIFISNNFFRFKCNYTTSVLVQKYTQNKLHN